MGVLLTVKPVSGFGPLIQVCLIRSNRLPMRPVTPEGPGRRCVKVCAVTNTVNRKGKKKVSDGIGTTDFIGEGKNLPTDSQKTRIVPLSFVFFLQI